MEKRLLFLIILCLNKALNNAADCRTQAAIDENYEIYNDKYYKFYGAGKTYLEAERFCNSHGARLAMYKTEPDYEAVKHYYEYLSPGPIWVGLVNKRMNDLCDSSQCDEYHYWIDGEPLTQDFLQADGNNNLPCTILLNVGVYITGDDWCHQTNKPFLCQLDCDNIYVEPAPECPEAANGYIKAFHGDEYYYKVKTGVVHPPRCAVLLLAMWGKTMSCSL